MKFLAVSLAASGTLAAPMLAGSANNKLFNLPGQTVQVPKAAAGAALNSVDWVKVAKVPVPDPSGYDYPNVETWKTGLTQVDSKHDAIIYSKGVADDTVDLKKSVLTSHEEVPVYVPKVDLCPVCPIESFVWYATGACTGCEGTTNASWKNVR